MSLLVRCCRLLRPDKRRVVQALAARTVMTHYPIDDVVLGLTPDQVFFQHMYSGTYLCGKQIFGSLDEWIKRSSGSTTFPTDRWTKKWIRVPK